MIKLTYKRKNRIKITEEQDSPSAKPETETLIETVQVSVLTIDTFGACW